MLTNLDDNTLRMFYRAGRNDARKGLLPCCKPQGQSQEERQESLKRSVALHRRVVKRIGRNPTFLEWAQASDEYESGYCSVDKGEN